MSELTTKKRRNRFVTPATIRIDLTDGDWIEVKERLTYAEQKRLAGQTFRPVVNTADLTPTQDSESRGTDMELDLEWYSILRIKLWVVAWSFVDAAGNPVRPTMDAIRALDSETGDEIEEALNEHVEAMNSQKNPEQSEESNTG